MYPKKGKFYLTLGILSKLFKIPTFSQTGLGPSS